MIFGEFFIKIGTLKLLIIDVRPDKYHKATVCIIMTCVLLKFNCKAIIRVKGKVVELLERKEIWFISILF